MSNPTMYEVSVSNVFEASSPEEAVACMVAWLTDWATQAGYSVEDNEGRAWFIDAEELDLDTPTHDDVDERPEALT